VDRVLRRTAGARDAAERLDARGRVRVVGRMREEPVLVDTALADREPDVVGKALCVLERDRGLEVALPAGELGRGPIRNADFPKRLAVAYGLPAQRAEIDRL